MSYFGYTQTDRVRLYNLYVIVCNSILYYFQWKFILGGFSVHKHRNDWPSCGVVCITTALSAGYIISSTWLLPYTLFVGKRFYLCHFRLD